jgi:hypothetical protein
VEHALKLLKDTMTKKILAKGEELEAKLKETQRSKELSLWKPCGKPMQSILRMDCMADGTYMLQVQTSQAMTCGGLQKTKTTQSYMPPALLKNATQLVAQFHQQVKEARAKNRELRLSNTTMTTTPPT